MALFLVSRSTSLPLLNVAPARTSGTRCGALTARQRRLCSLDEFEGHRDPCGPRAWSFGHALAQADGRKRRLDWVRGPQMDPVLGGVVVEREEHVDVVGDLHRGFGPLGPVITLERLHRRQSVLFVLGLPNLRQRGLRARLDRFGQAIEGVRYFVKLMPTSA